MGSLIKVLFVYYSHTEEAFLPVGLASLGGILKEYGIESKIFDTSFWNDTTFDKPTIRDRETREALGLFKKVPGFNPKKEDVCVPIEFEKVVEEYKPGLIAITSTSQEFRTIMNFVTPVKKKHNIPVIVGGSHATILPEKVICEEGIDIVCIGEGEQVLLEIVKRLERHQGFENVKGIMYKDPGGSIHKNKMSCNVQMMDELPEPNWDIIDPRHRIRPFEGELKRQAFFELSRGCPYNCSYCINATLHKIQKESGNKVSRTYRYYGAKEVIRRLKKYKDIYEFNHLQFVDESMLAMPASNFEELARLYKEEVDVSFFVQSRPEFVVKHPEKAKMLAQMGCRMIGMGAESGNEELRRTVLNRPMKNGILERASEILKDAGIMVATYYIIGFPGETKEMVEETIAMHKRIAPHRHSIRFLYPFPGTEIRSICVENGWFPDDFEDKAKPQSFFVEPIINLPSPPHPTKEELIELRNKFSEAWLWRG